MPIPEAQLETWAKVGAEKTAETTYTSIKAAIDAAATTFLRDYLYEVYLQGSYINSTSIYGDMDVDVVVEATNFFYSDTKLLTQAQEAEFERQYPGSAPVTFRDFRDCVQNALEDYYGSSLVTPQNKCILVTGQSGRLDADVVPSVTFNEYRKNETVKLPTPEVGMTFWTRKEHRQVINFPKQHLEYGIAKNKRVNYRFKPTVRVFKNLRNYCLAENLLADAVAPSYFVSCLIYNAPDNTFCPTHWDTMLAILSWLYDLKDEQWEELVCQNELYHLVYDAPDYWPLENAKAFMDAAILAWNDWDK
jgi:hypothetical protein